MEIKLISFIQILESILCLHRSISSSTCLGRVLRYFHVLWELLLLSSNGVKNHLYATQLDKTSTSLIFYTNTINSTGFIILSLYKSKKYKQMLKYLNMNHFNFKADQRYDKNLAIILTIVKVSLLMLFVLEASFFVVARLFNSVDVTNTIILFVAYIYYAAMQMCDVRFFFEFFALFSILNVMSEQLASITRSVQEFEVVGKGRIPDDEYKEKLNVFDKWSAAYTNVAESSKLFNNVYGLQVYIFF